MGSKQKNLIGETFTNLLVTKQLGSVFFSGTKKRMWECDCFCGNKGIIVPTGALTSGNTKSCGCLNKGKANSKKSRYKLAKRETGFNTIKASYKRNAEKRGLVWDLSDEDLISLFKDSCYYCNSPPSNQYSNSFYPFIYSGIDRVDNSLGYLRENCVSCCSICNHAKHTMSQKEFILWIERLTHNIEVLKGKLH